MVRIKEKEASAEPEEDFSGIVTVVGNLTRDPELGRGKDRGTPYARTGLAVETPVEPGEWSGERQTEFYELVCFGSLAQHVEQSLAKGMRVIVTGRAEIDTWTPEDGDERVTKRIVIDAIGPELRWANATVTKTTNVHSTKSTRSK